MADASRLGTVLCKQDVSEFEANHPLSDVAELEAGLIEPVWISTHVITKSLMFSEALPFSFNQSVSLNIDTSSGYHQSLFCSIAVEQ